MHVYHELSEIKPQSAAVAIGNFDGVHLGHRELLNSMIKEARANKLVATALTFFPHPVEVLNPMKSLERLTTASEKLDELETLGCDAVLVAKFSTELAMLPPEEFYQRFLKLGLGAKTIHVGYNFRFGKNREGDTEKLKSYAAKDGVHVNVLPPFELDGEKVSSSEIRALIRAGDVAEARKLLGRYYSISGLVSRGDGRGKTLGFPTANLLVPEEKVLPKNGVYVTRVRWQRQYYRSVSNVGVRPTFLGASSTRPVVETHILGLSARLYDEEIRLEFLSRIRDEKKFTSVEELKKQIAADTRVAGFFSPEEETA